jgi:hypothetical protein
MFATVLTAALTALAAKHGPIPDKARVGQIIVYGNVRTERDTIEKELGFAPGERMPSEADRLKAELRLLMKFHKRFDLDAGKRPQILVIGNLHNKYWDVEVQFFEKDE